MLASIFPLLLFFIACLFTFDSVYLKGEYLWDQLLYNMVFFSVGIQGLWAAIGHLFFPEQAAKHIGWKSSGFQTEIGFVNLSLGIVGVMTYWNFSWILPVGLIAAIFYTGCAYIHIKERIQKSNKAPCNSGPMLYSTIMIAACLYTSVFVLLS